MKHLKLLPCSCEAGEKKLSIVHTTRYKVRCSNCRKVGRWFNSSEKAVKSWNEMRRKEIEETGDCAELLKQVFEESDKREEERREEVFFDDTDDLLHGMSDDILTQKKLDDLVEAINAEDVFGKVVMPKPILNKKTLDRINELIEIKDVLDERLAEIKSELKQLGYEEGE